VHSSGMSDVTQLRRFAQPKADPVDSPCCIWGCRTLRDGGDWLSTSDITTYEVTCRVQLVADNCPGNQWIKLRKTTYKVGADSVVSQVEGSLPQRLSQCAVIDKRNWQCHDEGFVVGFTGGEFWRGAPGIDGKVIRFPGSSLAPRWVWLMAADKGSAP
jgi:hypothetical protein